MKNTFFYKKRQHLHSSSRNILIKKLLTGKKIFNQNCPKREWFSWHVPLRQELWLMWRLSEGNEAHGLSTAIQTDISFSRTIISSLRHHFKLPAFLRCVIPHGLTSNLKNKLSEYQSVLFCPVQYVVDNA